MSRDIPHEAKILVKRMTSDFRVKINEHWKVCLDCLKWAIDKRRFG